MLQTMGQRGLLQVTDMPTLGVVVLNAETGGTVGPRGFPDVAEIAEVAPIPAPLRLVPPRQPLSTEQLLCALIMEVQGLRAEVREAAAAAAAQTLTARAQRLWQRFTAFISRGVR